MSKHILVVDTREHGMHPLVQGLTDAGYAPTVMLPTDQPAEHLGDKDFELVFINCATGAARQVCESIRDTAEGAITPILFVGPGTEGIDSPATALGVGGDYHFALPLDLSKVLAKVQTYLGPARGGLPRTPDFVPPVAEAKSPLARPADAVLAQIARSEAAMTRRAQQVQKEQERQTAEARRRNEQQEAQTRAAARAREEAAARQAAAIQRAEEDERRQQAERRQAEQMQAQLAAAEAATERIPTRPPTDIATAWPAAGSPEPAWPGRSPNWPASAGEPNEQALAALRVVEAETAARAAEAQAARQRADAEATVRRAEQEAVLRLAAQEQARRYVGETALWPAPAAPAPSLRPLQPERGGLSAQTDVATVLCQAALQSVSGRIDFAAPQRTLALSFDRGAVVHAQSTADFDRFEAYLLREDKLTRPQYQALRIKNLRTARQAGAFLVGEGALKPQELFEAVRGHLQEQVLGLFEWEEGTFAYVAQSVDEAERTPLAVAPLALVAEGIRRKYILGRLQGKLGAAASLLGVHPGAEALQQALALSPGEAAIARLLDGQRSLEDVAFSLGCDILSVYQVAWMLSCCGAAQVLVRALETQGDGAPAGEGIDRDRIADKAAQARSLDYFAVLGVPRSATTYEIERACDRLARDFAAARFSNAVQGALADDLQDIAEVVDEAREILTDPQRREAYARHAPSA